MPAGKRQEVIKIIPILIVLCVLTALAAGFFAVRYFGLRLKLKRLTAEYDRLLREDTNALLHLSPNEKSLGAFAEALNRELGTLRDLRHTYSEGDKKVKEAVINISHDLRTPLAAIRSYLDLLCAKPLTEEQTVSVEVIRRRTEEMSELTEELFRYAISAGEEQPERFEPVNVNSLLEETLLSFYAAFRERQITPVCALPAHPVTRLADCTTLKRIFSNLISNALKYSEKDFSLTMDENGVICFSNRAEELTPIDVEHLFDRYFTVKSNAGATGLGLSIARLLAERAGYEITASHEMGILTIYLKV